MVNRHAQADGEAMAVLHRCNSGSRLWLYTTSIATCAVTIAVVGKRRRKLLTRARPRAGAGDREGKHPLEFREIFVTGKGEPFPLGDIGDILTACAAAAPTTVLTNGMLLSGDA